MSENANWRQSDRFKNFKLMAIAHITEGLAEAFCQPAKVDFSDHTYFFLDETTMRVVQKVFGRELERQEVEYPADWWQAFKDRWFPGWAKRRWPVNMTNVVMVARELYPQGPGTKPIVVVDKS